MIITVVVVSARVLMSCGNKEEPFYAKDELKIDIGGDMAQKRAMRKFSLNFNKHRKENNIPLLPENFGLVSSGTDYAQWGNLAGKYPGLETKMVVFEIGGPSLLYEQNIIKGEKNDYLTFRYSREYLDSFLLNYSTLSKEFREDTDSLFKRYYSYIDSSGVRKGIDKNAYDSIIRKWKLTGL